MVLWRQAKRAVFWVVARLRTERLFQLLNSLVTSVLLGGKLKELDSSGSWVFTLESKLGLRDEFWTIWKRRRILNVEILLHRYE